MSNEYWELTDDLDPHTLGRAEQLNGILLGIQGGFDKLPSPAALREGRHDYVVDTGAANSYVVTLPITLQSYTSGLTFKMKVSNTNTGPSTVNVNGLGVVSIRTFAGEPLPTGYITAGAIVTLSYDGSAFLVTGGNSLDPSESAAEAGSYLAQMKGIYYGKLPADPVVDPNGDPLDEGDWYFNTSTKRARIYNGSSWGDIISAAELNSYVFTASGGETLVAGTDDNGATLSYTAGFLQVFKNGERLIEDVDYSATDGWSIAVLSPLTGGDVLFVDAFTPFDVGTVPLLPENNLDDLDNPVTARTNLGLGGAATRSVANTATVLSGAGSALVPSEEVTAALQWVTLTDASTVSVNGQAFVNGVLVMGGNRTLANITDPVIGRTYVIDVRSDSSTDRTLTLGDKYVSMVGLNLSGITNAAGNRLLLSIHVRDANTFIVSGGRF